MPGPAPKPDDQRRRRNTPTFDWTLLPGEGRSKPAPDLPANREWCDASRSEWAYWWSTPQATAWDQSGHSLHRWITLLDMVLANQEAPVSLHAQILALEDRHGFSPAAMLKLRWRIVADELGERREHTPPSRRRASARTQTAALAARLQPVPPPAAPEAPVETKRSRKRAPAKKAPAKSAARTKAKGS